MIPKKNSKSKLYFSRQASRHARYSDGPCTTFAQIQLIFRASKLKMSSEVLALSTILIFRRYDRHSAKAKRGGMPVLSFNAQWLLSRSVPPVSDLPDIISNQKFQSLK